MPAKMPAVSLAAVPGRRKATVELAKDIEKRGFSGIYCPSLGDPMALCEALAIATDEIPFGTSIMPIYFRHVIDYAQTASFIHELSGGRFRFGIGVSHGPVHERLSIKPGKPLGDTRQFVEEFNAVERVGDKPPIVLATLRKKMIALSGEIAGGMVFANGALSHMKNSLTALPGNKAGDPDFFIGDMIPTVITDDIEAAKAVNRKTLTSYAMLPNYRNYWREAGYGEEMDAVEEAIAEHDPGRIPDVLSDRWLDDVTLFGPPARVRERVEMWFDSGIKTPILVPSSANGGQMKAFEELFAAFG